MTQQSYVRHRAKYNFAVGGWDLTAEVVDYVDEDTTGILYSSWGGINHKNRDRVRGHKNKHKRYDIDDRAVTNRAKRRKNRKIIAEEMAHILEIEEEEYWDHIEDVYIKYEADREFYEYVQREERQAKIDHQDYIDSLDDESYACLYSDYYGYEASFDY